MIVAPDAAQLARAASMLRDGGVIAFPTETVYGLGANAFDALAVARIFEIKERPAFDPLIVHVADEAMLDRVVDGVPTIARRLIEAFWPGPLTLVLRKRDEVPGLVTSGLPTVGVRMPAHPVAHALLVAAGVPLAAPSANRFGRLSPTRAEHVAAGLGDRIELILDGGPSAVGVESTILLLEPQPVLLRPGAVTIEAIEAIAGPVARGLDDRAAPLAPGRLEQHYAPRTPLRIVDPRSVPPAERTGAGALLLSGAVDGYAQSRALSRAGDLREAAATLFAALHELDVAGLARIDAEPVTEAGLGLAIMDRLRRAAAR